MIRGTTAQFKFNLPYSKDELTWVTIKFWQPNNTNPLLPITRRMEDCADLGDGSGLYVSLTAEETMRFTDKYKAKMQMRAQHINGTVFGTRTQYLTVYPMSDDIIGENPILPREDAEGWVILDGQSVIG